MSEDDATIDTENLLDPEYVRTATDGEIVHLPSDLRKALNVSENLENGKKLKVVLNTDDNRVDDHEIVTSFRFVSGDESEEGDGE